MSGRTRQNPAAARSWFAGSGVGASENWLEFAWRDLRSREAIASGSEVNWLIDRFGCEDLRGERNRIWRFSA